MTTKILVTGGAGFIGSAVVRYIINNQDATVINVDKLTYAGNLNSLSDIADKQQYIFELCDICDHLALEHLFKKHRPSAVMHLAAESHVDRSIEGPSAFISTNVVGTYHLLEVARDYWQSLEGSDQNAFRFHHISTDEVFGDLASSPEAFRETTPYDPSSPYSASKAASDHLVRAWSRTYGLPVLITNCSNNYGPYQYPEKLIPQVILNALLGKSLPIYGDGKQVRDWLFVEDHARILYAVMINGEVGNTYNIGGCNERKNIEVVSLVCDLLEELIPEKPAGIRKYQDLITFVEDRSGHDQRYAIDASKIRNELGLVPQETFESGLKKTVRWYIANKWWWQPLLDRESY